MSVLNPALEAAIARDPDDLDAYAVYGDWLAEHGDPRGELIATQLAAASGDAEMKRAALRVFAKYRETFVGKLGSMIAADAFTWRAGFIERAVLSFDRLLIEGGARVASSLAEVVAALLAHPSGRFLRELVIKANDRNAWNQWTGSQKDVVAALATRRLDLRRLQLGDVAYGAANIGKIDALWPVLGDTVELVVQGDVSFGDVDAPALQSLRLWPLPMRKKLARELLEAKWPSLRSLELHLGNSATHVTREVITLLFRQDLALAHLGILACSQGDTLLDVLSRAPLLKRLETLSLRQARISERGLRPLLVHADRFAHLAQIDLTDIAISAKVLVRLRAVLPNVVGKSD